MIAHVAWDGVPLDGDGWTPGGVLITDAQGRVMMTLQYAPELADHCFRALLKNLVRCECGSPYVRTMGPRRRCPACSAKREGFNAKERSRRYRARKQQNAIQDTPRGGT